MKATRNNGAIKFIAAAISLVVLLAFLLKGRLEHMQFDSRKWKDWKETETTLSLRWDMMNSLRNNYELFGKSKKEIIELLGEPDTKIDFKFSYYLGYSKRGINTGHLVIEFDENEKVKTFKVMDG